MRRKDREITDFNIMLAIVEECDIIRIGLADGEFPYIVPVNFAYTVENQQLKFYIHGAYKSITLCKSNIFLCKCN